MSPLSTACSGADGLPDNSLEYVRHALATQADALEVDVRPGNSGSLVINIFQGLVTRRFIEALSMRERRAKEHI